MLLVGGCMYFANFPTSLACIPDIHYGLVDIRVLQIQEAASMIQKFLPSLSIPIIQGPGHFIPLDQTAFWASLPLGSLVKASGKGFNWVLLLQAGPPPWGLACALGPSLRLRVGPPLCDWVSSLHFTSLLAGHPPWGRA